MNQVRNKLVLPGLLLLAACGPLVTIGDSGPAPQRFALALAADNSSVQALPLPSLRVEELESPAELANARMAVRIGAQEVRYVKGGVWTERPARMMRGLIGEALRQRSTGLIVSGTQVDIVPAYRLTGRLIAFQADAAGGLATRVLVRSEQLLIATKTASVEASRHFEASAPASSDRPADIAAAANTAANLVAAQTAAWVSAELAR
jgi:cholesterol transport system auxiliary component